MKRFGWIKSIRTSKPVKYFISCTDGFEADFQVSVPHEVDVDGDGDGDLKVGASILIEGKPSRTPKGLYEFLASSVKVIGKSDDSYPIQAKPHTNDFLRTIPEHRGRARNFQAIWKIRHVVSQHIHRFLSERQFYQYYAPVITKADCEGAGETFSVKSDWLDANLTVSAQLQGEVGMMSLGRAYVFGPCFRAEKSATKKHLSEFWMVEPEAAFFDLDQTMELAEIMIKSILVNVMQECSEELEILELNKSHLENILGVPHSQFKRIQYQDVIKEFDVTYGQDISTEIEKKVVKKYGPTFITHYPASLKPFYMRKEAGETYCFDLIFPQVGELIGGSERESDYDTLKKEMESAGLDMSKMQWYLDTRKYGSVPHAGFGLGLERLVSFITKADKVHDVIPFPVSF